MIVDRITDMVESNGGRVIKVPAAYTSKKCHRCGESLDMNTYHTPICVTCRVAWDRDENAAANIAARLKDKDRHKKACQTRKKSASKNRRRNSKNTARPLKHPLKKTSPTPKAPQNRPKPKNSHRVHHKHTVIKKREGGVSCFVRGRPVTTMWCNRSCRGVQQWMFRQQAARLFQL